MVVALDALEAAIAAAPGKLGADARRRLFATLVAGAMGMVLPLEIDLKKAGKRMEPRVCEVRSLMSDLFTSEIARAAKDATAVAESDVDDSESLDTLRLKPFTKFFELDAELVRSMAPAPAPVPVPAPAMTVTAAVQEVDLPGWVERALGPPGAQAFRLHVSDLDESHVEFADDDDGCFSLHL